MKISLKDRLTNKPLDKETEKWLLEFYDKAKEVIALINREDSPFEPNPDSYNWISIENDPETSSINITDLECDDEGINGKKDRFMYIENEEDKYEGWVYE